HEKGSFTGAHEARKGYFEVVDGGTIFLDEVAELPLSTQVRLLRVLESGEFLKVGSSKVIKTDVRIVAASNVNIPEAIEKGKFRQDLYYRLNTVPIMIPPLRNRKDDIFLLFKKFANDFAEKYHMPPLQLTAEAINLLETYRWPGNIRQLKNVTEQISIIEQQKVIDAPLMRLYLPEDRSNVLPVLYKKNDSDEKMSERDILYKVLFDMKKDILDLRKTMAEIISKDDIDEDFEQNNNQLIRQYRSDLEEQQDTIDNFEIQPTNDPGNFQPSEVIDENLSLEKTEIDMIKRALEKHKGKRKNAAKELGISERTLYRKIKEYDLNL
ncbi:MAG: sigma 54-interacting transcriptional regulator, partial [Bacteroidetes bacterium]|nr:sigma 54-interacting transcriptional regulator [Bacteroidota bacterium]MBU1580519.1 sigma 54-interacting transcriptional regulator [Bacteroidota bacterium]MBU2464905.1 sigma 54-interacting transcriptional regulator [Bacteroidota bacterium]